MFCFKTIWGAEDPPNTFYLAFFYRRRRRPQLNYFYYFLPPPKAVVSATGTTPGARGKRRRRRLFCDLLIKLKLQNYTYYVLSIANNISNLKLFSRVSKANEVPISSHIWVVSMSFKQL